MNDMIARAVALQGLIASEGSGTPPARPLAEGVVQCSIDLVSAGETDLALSLMEAATSVVAEAGPEWTLRLDLARVRALSFRGESQQALELCRSLGHHHSGLLASLPTESIELRISEGACLWMLNRVEEATERLMAVRTELLRLPDSALLARCALQLSSAAMRRGTSHDARAHALESIVSARRCGNRYLEGVALNNLGQIDRSYCRWQSAEEACSAALGMFERDGNSFQADHARRSLAIVLWKRGKLDVALEMAGRCIEGSSRASSALAEWYACLLSGMVLLHLGRAAEAYALFTRESEWTTSCAEYRPALLTTEFLGDIHLEQGQAEPALKHYDEVWPKALALVPRGDIVAELRRRRAECYYLLGRHDEAYAEAKTGLDHCRELGDRYEEAAIYRVLALAAAAIGRPEEAKRWFDQGFAYYDDIETPYEWGKLWMSYGDWISGPHAGEYADARGAREAYRAARDHFEHMGALAKLNEAMDRLARLGSPEGASAPDRTRSPGAGHGNESTRPQRRPRGSTELDRRSAWALESFGFVTRNRLVLDRLTEVGKLAAAGSPMLILGESGTGKELIAHGVHRLSGRTGNFLPINCGALPREVIESELFGHVAGAFTGAAREKAGLLEVCDGGTAFLDEIAEMSIELQSRLLRFLETGEIRRVGANRNLAVNTLVVAATNRDRASLEKGERFRPDLYYRLAHAVVLLPPLRRRSEDIDLLIGHFFDEACREQQKRVVLSDAARNRLIAYPWPGNVRQLRAVLRRLVILAPADHRIAADEVQLDEAEIAGTLTEELEQAERRRMVEALSHSGGSRSDAARALGMARTTFVTKMKRYGIR
jgi:tetratricopeptide (TPR) repeat protein